MSTLIDKLLNLLGFFQLTAEEYYDAYGYQFYVPSMLQVNNQLISLDELLINVIEAELGQMIEERTIANDAFLVDYDFNPHLDGLGYLQQKRVYDKVLDGLEKKGYRLRENFIDGAMFTIRIVWTIQIYRMFKATPPANPSTPGIT